MRNVVLLALYCRSITIIKASAPFSICNNKGNRVIDNSIHYRVFALLEVLISVLARVDPVEDLMQRYFIDTGH